MNVYYFDAMIVGLLAIVLTAAVAIVAVVHGRVAHESVLQRLVALLVPLEVPDHLLLLDKDARVAVQTVEMFPGNTEFISQIYRPIFLQFNLNKFDEKCRKLFFLNSKKITKKFTKIVIIHL